MFSGNLTSKEYFKTTLRVYLAILAGQIAFASISLFLVQSRTLNNQDKDLSGIFIYMVIFFVIYSVIAGNLFFKNKLQKCKNYKTLNEKLSNYRSALIIRYAMLEGASFFTIVAYLVTWELFYLGFAALIIIVFLMIKPSPKKIISDLELNATEQMKLNDPRAVVG